MKRIECPNCGSFLTIDFQDKIDKLFRCPDCETELIIINTEPLEVDYYYGDDFDGDYASDYDDTYYEEERYNDMDSADEYFDYNKPDE